VRRLESVPGPILQDADAVDDDIHPFEQGPPGGRLPEICEIRSNPLETGR